VIALFILGRFGQQIADQAKTRKAEFAKQD
jgi:hypothetical protein